MSQDCIFCRIVEGTIPSKKVYEDEHVIAFHDIQPQAPVHLLVVPKKHFQDVFAVDKPEVFGQLFGAAQKIAREQNLFSQGMRSVFNTGKHGCQSVFHVHLHLLGGKQLGGSMVG